MRVTRIGVKAFVQFDDYGEQQLIQRWLIVIMIATTLAGGAVAQDSEITTLTVPRLELAAGDSLVYEIVIDCLVDGCAAFDIRLLFDPTMLQIDDLEVGPYLGDNFYVVVDDVDTITGALRLAASALGDLPPTDATGLLRVHLTALGSGETSFNVDQLDLSDLLGNRVVVDVVVTAAPQLVACVVVAQANDTVQVRVGPGLNRTAVAFLPPGAEFLVQGKTTANQTVWYQLDKDQAAPGKQILEAWISSDDVVATGDCDAVTDTNAPPIIRISPNSPGGTTGGGGQATVGGSNIQYLQVSGAGCYNAGNPRSVRTVNPNPFELGVSWIAGDGQSGYFRTRPSGTNEFIIRPSSNNAAAEITVEVVVSTVNGDWIHTETVTTRAC